MIERQASLSFYRSDAPQVPISFNMMLISWRFLCLTCAIQALPVRANAVGTDRLSSEVIQGHTGEEASQLPDRHLHLDVISPLQRQRNNTAVSSGVLTAPSNNTLSTYSSISNIQAVAPIACFQQKPWLRAIDIASCQPMIRRLAALGTFSTITRNHAITKFPASPCEISTSTDDLPPDHLISIKASDVLEIVSKILGACHEEGFGGVQTFRTLQLGVGSWVDEHPSLRTNASRKPESTIFTDSSKRSKYDPNLKARASPSSSSTSNRLPLSMSPSAERPGILQSSSPGKFNNQSSVDIEPRFQCFHAQEEHLARLSAYACHQALTLLNSHHRQELSVRNKHRTEIGPPGCDLTVRCLGVRSGLTIRIAAEELATSLRGILQACHNTGYGGYYEPVARPWTLIALNQAGPGILSTSTLPKSNITVSENGPDNHPTTVSIGSPADHPHFRRSRVRCHSVYAPYIMRVNQRSCDKAITFLKHQELDLLKVPNDMIMNFSPIGCNLIARLPGVEIGAELHLGADDLAEALHEIIGQCVPGRGGIIEVAPRSWQLIVENLKDGHSLTLGDRTDYLSIRSRSNTNINSSMDNALQTSFPATHCHTFNDRSSPFQRVKYKACEPTLAYFRHRRLDLLHLPNDQVASFALPGCDVGVQVHGVHGGAELLIGADDLAFAMEKLMATCLPGLGGEIQLRPRGWYLMVEYPKQQLEMTRPVVGSSRIDRALDSGARLQLNVSSSISGDTSQTTFPIVHCTSMDHAWLQQVNSEACRASLQHLRRLGFDLLRLSNSRIALSSPGCNMGVWMAGMHPGAQIFAAADELASAMELLIERCLPGAGGTIQVYSASWILVVRNPKEEGVPWKADGLGSNDGLDVGIIRKGNRSRITLYPQSISRRRSQPLLSNFTLTSDNRPPRPPNRVHCFTAITDPLLDEHLCSTLLQYLSQQGSSTLHFKQGAYHVGHSSLCTIKVQRFRHLSREPDILVAAHDVLLATELILRDCRRDGWGRKGRGGYVEMEHLTLLNGLRIELKWMRYPPERPGIFARGGDAVNGRSSIVQHVDD